MENVCRNTSSTCPDFPRSTDMVVGMAYVPWQDLDMVYEPEDGFCQGTIFPELDKPWMIGGCGCER